MAEIETMKPLICGLQQRMANVLDSGRLSDVVIVVGQGQKIRKFPAHRNILAFASDYFEELFYVSRQGLELEVFLKDEDPDIFEKLLSYIYSDTLPKSLADLRQLYYRAERYKVSFLKEQCIQTFGWHLNQCFPKNVCSVYQFALEASIPSLIKKCALLVSISSEAVFKSASFLECNDDVIKEILSRERLNISSELALFRALLSWSKHHLKGEDPSRLRTLMEKFLPLIRFRSMSLEEFINGPAKSGIFTDEEVQWISDDIRGHNFYSCLPWYNLCRRTTRLEQQVEVSPSSSFYTSTMDFVEHFAAILKPASEDMVITKIGFENLSFGHELRLRISLADSNSESNAIAMNVSAYWDATCNCWVIVLPVPYILRKGVSYEFSLRKPATGRGFKGNFRDIKKCEWSISYSHKKDLRIAKISKYVFDYISIIPL